MFPLAVGRVFVIPYPRLGRVNSLSWKGGFEGHIPLT